MKFSATYWIPSIAIIALTATEIALRLAFGLGNPLLSQADPDTGYAFNLLKNYPALVKQLNTTNTRNVQSQLL